MHRFGHSPLPRANCQRPNPCQSDHEAKANRLLLPAKQGAFGFRKAPRGRAETQAQSEPKGGEDGGNGNGAEGRIGGAEHRKALERTMRVARVGRAVEVQRKGRPERKLMEAGKLDGGSADRPDAPSLTRWKRGREVGD